MRIRKKRRKRRQVRKSLHQDLETDCVSTCDYDPVIYSYSPILYLLQTWHPLLGTNGLLLLEPFSSFLFVERRTG